MQPTESTSASLLFGECSVPGWNFFYIRMKYNKQPLDIPALLAMLKARGLAIADEQEAGRILGLVSYFRLANYLRPMEADKETHQYKPNSSFENAVALYRFDAALREIVFRAISNIEIALRSKMIHHFSLKYGAFWFTNMSICNDEHLFLENLNAVDREVRRSKEDYIKEHFSKYKDSAFPPAWKAMELLSRGTLAKLFFNASDNKVKKKIAREFGLPNHLAFESWMNSIAALRNCCAHHARIWNRNYPVTPDLPKRLRNAWIKDTNTPFNKLYAQLCCMAYWYNAIDSQNTFTADIKDLLLNYPIVDPAAIGFVKNWQDEPLWK